MMLSLLRTRWEEAIFPVGMAAVAGIIILILALSGLLGCVPSTGDVINSQCQPGAACNSMEYWVGMEYFKQNVMDSTNWFVFNGLKSDDQYAYLTRIFEDWFYRNER